MLAKGLGWSRPVVPDQRTHVSLFTNTVVEDIDTLQPFNGTTGGLPRTRWQMFDEVTRHEHSQVYRRTAAFA
jgi:hypothetical protein